MPDVLAKHPDVVIQVLQSQGATCGAAGEPQILKDCPREAFCRLQGGELCVLGVDQVARSTQITAEDLAPQVCPKVTAAQTPDPGGCTIPADLSASAGAALVPLLLGAGVLAARLRRRRRR